MKTNYIMVICSELECRGLSRRICAQKWLFWGIYWPMGYEGGSRSGEWEKGTSRRAVDTDKWSRIHPWNLQ